VPVGESRKNERERESLGEILGESLRKTRKEKES